MSWRARYTGRDDVAVFVETSPGIFDAYISSDAYREEIYTTGDTQMAAAVATTAGKGVKWGNYYAAASGYPDGPLLSVTAYSSNANRPASPSSASYGPKVTVVDDHGTHVGTPVMAEERVILSGEPCGVVAVKHESTDDGYLFAGWRVTRVPNYSSSLYTMAYVTAVSSAAGTVNGLVTEYSSSELGDAALVLRIDREECDSDYDHLIVEAIYVDAPTSCTISFDPNAENVVAPAIPDMVIGFGASGRLPTPALWKRTGYSFAAWNTAADGSGTSYEANALFEPEDGRYWLTLFAQWAKVGGEGGRASSHFVGDDGINASSSYTHPYDVRVSVVGLAEDVGPVTIDYQTRLSSSSTTVVTSYNPGTGATTTTTTQHSEAGPTVGATFSLAPGEEAAVNVPATYQSYELRSGRNYGSQGSWTRQITRAYCSTSSSWLWVAPEIPGYDFVGWFTLDRSYVETDPPTDYIYSTLISPSPTVTWGELVNGLNRYRSYYYFSSSNVLVHDETHTNFLRLVYRGKRLRVKFNAAGGELDDLYREVRRLEGYGDMPIPSRPGYSFAGWYTERDGGELVTAETVVVEMEDHTLYAHWERVPVTMTVHFVPCGGTVDVESLQAVSGSVYGELPTPVRDGYEFLGWFTASLGGSAITADTVVGRTYTHWLYAQWTAITADEPDEPDEPGPYIGRFSITKKETQ